ncbi:MAG: hypothetical protein DRR08_25900 [Candidatus Parabeggiatoa sp. nov. 2]|nr:MAG: hypothetical protein DRR08_25900 [Gammaproteobacteria bacterium]
MSIRFFSPWLMIIVMLGLLSACGGGGDEPSSFFEDTGGNVGGDPPPASDETSADDFTSIEASLSAQQIIPSGGSTTVGLTTFIADEARKGEIAPNVSLKITVHPAGAAKLENVPNSTDHNGDMAFTVSHPGSGNVTVNVSGTGRIKKGFNIQLYFGASVTAEVISEDTVPADGTTPINLKVLARDFQGTGIPAISVDFSFPIHSFAVPTAIGQTNEHGEFSTGITNTVAQTTKVTPVAGGMAAGSLRLNFDTSQVVTVPKRLDLIVSSNNVPANGEATATLIVIARDTTGTPVPNIPINISSDSATAQLKIGEESNTLFINGNTGPDGRIELNITNTVEETVNIAAAMTSGGETKEQTEEIKFTNPKSASGVDIDSIELDEPVNSPSEPNANGTDTVTLIGKVIDKEANPVANIPVSILKSGGSAMIRIANNGKTNQAGIFIATFTDTVVEQFTARAVVGDISSDPVTISFAAKSQEEDPTETFPGKIIILATPEQQFIEEGGSGDISLTVIVRDEDNTPVSDVSVIMEASSSTAIFDKNFDKTGDNGTTSFKISDTVAGRITVTATVEGQAGPIRQSKYLSFVKESGDVPIGGSNVRTLDVHVFNNNQAADGQASIQIDVVARDSNGGAVEKAPILVQMSAGTAAVANPSRQETDSNGFFQTQITSTKAGDVAVSIVVEGTAIVSEPQIITFTAQTGPDVPPAKVELEVINNRQPADGESKITLIATPKNASGTPLAGVDIKFIDDSDNVEITGGQTNALGEYRVSVTSNVAESFKVTPVAKDTITGTPVVLTFISVDSGTIDFQVLNNNRPADDQSTITLVVTFRDASGNPIPDAPVQFIDDSNNIEISGGNTNALGEFRTTVKSSVSETIKVTPVVKDIIGVQKTITFSSVDSGTIDFQVLNNNQPADDQSTITLVVTFRDASGNPIQDADVKFIDDSNTVEISGGNTNALGEFRTSVKSKVPETIKVTPVVKNIVGEEKTLTFISLGTTVTDLSVNVVGDNQAANGTDEIQIDVVARSSGRAVKGALITVQLPAGSAAVAKPSQGTTNENGLFTTKLTSTEAGEVKVKIVIEGATATLTEERVVTFKASSSVTPMRVDLNVENAPQPADDNSAITLVVIPRDANNTPIPEVEVELASDSTTAKIAESKGETNALGEFRTTVTNTVAETFRITPIAGGVTGNPFLVTFNPIGENVELQVTVVNNNQAANGSDEIQIDVVAREGGEPKEGIPLVVLIDSGAAVAVPSRKTTDENGFFSTKIKSTEAGLVHVTIRDESTGVAAEPKQINFIAESGITPTTVELIAKNAPQPADNQSKITLVVIPRDARGTPAVGVDVELIADSDQIQIESVTGQTNALGEFRTTVVTATDMTETLTTTLVVNVTPVAGGIVGEPTPVIFTPVAVPIPATLSLTVTNNNVEAGQEATITVLARDNNGSPMAGVPVKLSVAPGDEPPDITGSALFGSNGFEGNTAENSGVFETTLKNNQPGTVKVTAAALGRDGAPLLNSNTVEVVFKSAPDDEVKEVSSLRLITDSPQLGSEGSSEGVTLTAIVKNKANNLVEGAVVSFSATSGEIQPLTVEGSSLAGVTNESGQAQARLTTVGNADNRTITVKATVPTTTGEIREASVEIEVTGTAIIVTGQDTIILGSTVNLGISLKDSAGNGVGGQTLTVSSSLGNTIDNLSPVTNASGQANVELTANVAGEDTITVSKPGVVSGELKINISDDNFTLTSFPDSGATEINLNTSQEFLVHWDKGKNIPQANKAINISSTRGSLNTNNVVTDTNGDARFTISANNSGPAVITATVAGGGSSAQISVYFIAIEANTMTLQAAPVTIAVNTPDSEAEQSEITAVLRDSKNNLVKGKRLDFSLEDVTGGRLFPSSAVTDSFGRASTVYFAGTSSSAANGVKVTATVVDTPSVTASVRLTVAAKSLFVTLGTGNKIEIDGPTRYKYPYNVLVNDANGVAITDTDVVLSVLPLAFGKGYYFWDGTAKFWRQVMTTSPACENEDTLSRDRGDDFNGILDNADEDRNSNGKLEPGNVATFDSGGVLKTVETDANGFADFYIVYAKEYANWVEVQLTATVTVTGSEGSGKRIFWIGGAAEDYTNEKVSPPGNPSPFGVGNVIADTEDKNGNGILDGDEDGRILFNGRLDTEDLNGNGILDPGEDGTILSHVDQAGKDVFINPRVGELDTEDADGDGVLDKGEDINNNGLLDITYLRTCDTTE